MKKMHLRKALALMMCVVFIASLFAGCSNQGSEPAANNPPQESPESGVVPAEKKPEDFTGELTFWHFNKDEGPKLAEAFMGKYPNVKVNVQITSDTDLAYQNKVTSAIRAGSGMPDVLAAENAFVKRFVNLPGGFENLSAAPFNAEEYVDANIPYTVDIGRDNAGNMRALSWQACPGGVGYKRDLAKKYLGTDDPDEISAMLSTPEKIVETARKVKEASKGKAKLFVGTEDLYKIYVGGARTQPWVKDNKFIIDPKMLEYIDIAKTMRDEGLEGGIRQWTPAWSAAVADDIHMCYAIPTWGIQWIVAVNDEKNAQAGRWAVATPMPYYEGGTWAGISQQSKNKELAWEFVKFLATDKEHLKAWAIKTGDFVNHIAVIEELKNDSSFVNKTVNQNTYEVYGPMVEKVNGNLITQYDDQMRKSFQDIMQTYLAGKITKEQFIQQFKEKVKSDLPDLIVE
ncbi:ABC-type glycerol-3-phosphate transport system, substrate-binding protein [Geosporobacter subterraneus DSM 17957]|uniref:ABC-type glycerol-3-phosphate transport system, substrate-binding protein n=1 Tax=Geosporobacter subterraneus DSM 17957 TaxID=1121919 RepID=A0A1M6L669_9FIRM|nr:ABC transporter substrate-binding protein [Geosporobacter subterraneus]SHJ66748.1 ABC-type glycerol-3-phosphate transport system, substrate-binding protein [Geosporobacter subterraneus DSM 17957]